MYLLFFLLRDGAARGARDPRRDPARRRRVKARLLERFTTVIRATVKGNILVAAAQGALGGLAFWVLGVHAPMLWGVVMAFLSLLPAVGAALIWVPVALYLLATGQVWQGVGLIAFGVFVIGLIDNVLRPILVGKDTPMPDYVVLISTVGGLALFGLNGFVIGPVIAAMFIDGVADCSRPSAPARDAAASSADELEDCLPCLLSEHSYPSRVGSPSSVHAAAALARCALFRLASTDSDGQTASDRIRELEARLVAHGIVLKTIARLLSDIDARRAQGGGAGHRRRRHAGSRTRPAHAPRRRGDVEHPRDGRLRVAARPGPAQRRTVPGAGNLDGGRIAACERTLPLRAETSPSLRVTLGVLVASSPCLERGLVLRAADRRRAGRAGGGAPARPAPRRSAGSTSIPGRSSCTVGDLALAGAARARRRCSRSRASTPTSPSSRCCAWRR